MGLSRKRRVVVVGGGYAGVRVVRDLARLCADTVEIVLVSESDVHTDVTSYYEVATTYLPHESSTSSEQILAGASLPLTTVLGAVPVQIRVGRVERIDRGQRIVVLASGETLGYEWLVLTVGSSTATYGIAGVGRYTFFLKTLSDAVIARHHMMRQFRQAKQAHGRERAALLTFVIVGGGLTGVETAAELAAAASRQCQAHSLSRDEVKIVVIEAGERILSMTDPTVSARAMQRLAQLGVMVWCRQAVVAVVAGEVRLRDGRTVATQSVIWAGGLAPNPLLLALGLPLARWGLRVRPTLQTIEDPHIYAAGDAAVWEAERPLPATVPVAYSQAALVAQNIRHQLQREALEPYSPRTWPILVALGGRWGMLIWPRGQVWTGVGPWLIKQLVSLRYWHGYVSWLVAVPHWWRGFRVRLGNDAGVGK